MLHDKNWQTLLLNADVKILSFTVSRVMGQKLPGLLVLLMAFVGGITFFFEISAIIAVKYESWWILSNVFSAGGKDTIQDGIQNFLVGLTHLKDFYSNKNKL